jgi:preprotein translocase subunit SecA
MLSARGFEHQVLNAVRHVEEAQVTAAAGQPGKITVATNMAGRGTDIKLGAGMADLGGLHVIATERHEAGRIDRQLFGRAARQGDPGSAGALVSLEDELVRRYAPHLSASLRKRYGRTEREVSGAITRRVFNMAQRRAERMALSQRKGVLRSDDWLDEYLGFAGAEH